MNEFVKWAIATIVGALIVVNVSGKYSMLLILIIILGGLFAIKSNNKYGSLQDILDTLHPIKKYLG